MGSCAMWNGVRGSYFAGLLIIGFGLMGLMHVSMMGDRSTSQGHMNHSALQLERLYWQ